MLDNGLRLMRTAINWWLVVGLYHGSLAYPEASIDCMNIRKEAMIRAQ